MIDFIPTTILGIPTMVFVGFVVGIIFAVYEAMVTKFRKVVLKVEANGQTISFDNRYLITALIGALVVVLTIEGIKESGLLDTIPNTVVGLSMALMMGFTEGWAVIRALNTRLDVYIKNRAMQLGKTEEEAQNLADSVEFIEVADKSKSKTDFDEL